MELVKSCHETYAASDNHLGPETWSWDDQYYPSDQQEFFEENGFHILEQDYRLRPEVIESYYYAYVLTGDPMYREWAWQAFMAINKWCRTEVGYSSIRGSQHRHTNMQESFWFAEVLKYLYLIFYDGESPVGVTKGKQTWVFNTEAHPFKTRL